MLITGTVLLALKAAALKAGPIIAAKVTPIIVAKAGVILASSGALVAKLASAPALKAVAVKLITSEAFQAFAIKLATSEIGKTIIIKGVKITVTREMKKELLEKMKNDKKFAEAMAKATGKAASTITGELLNALK